MLNLVETESFCVELYNTEFPFEKRIHGGTEAQWVTSMPRGFIALLLSQAYCLCGVLQVLTISVWVSVSTLIPPNMTVSGLLFPVCVTCSGLPDSQCSWERLYIHCDPNQNKALA